MPYTIAQEKYGVIKTFSGHVTGDEFIQSIMQTQSLFDYDRMRYTLNDCIEIASHSITEHDLIRASAYGIGAGYGNPTIRVALVSLNPEIKAMAMRFASLTVYDLSVHENVAHARAWCLESVPYESS